MMWRARMLCSLLMARLLAVRGFDAIQVSLHLRPVLATWDIRSQKSRFHSYEFPQPSLCVCEI